jgi:hypothetical protein
MSIVMARKGRPPTPRKPPEVPRMLVAITSFQLLLVWLVTPIWFAVLMTAVCLLLLFYERGDADE